MKHLPETTSPSPFSGENWFDRLKAAIRNRKRAFTEAVVPELSASGADVVVRAINAAARPRVIATAKRFRQSLSAPSER